jgi:hypothetical protein
VTLVAFKTTTIDPELTFTGASETRCSLPLVRDAENGLELDPEPRLIRTVTSLLW